jgi:SulP family sulfate permease
LGGSFLLGEKGMLELFQEWLGLLKREFKGYNRAIFQKDLLAGLTVAAVAALALAFGVASGADAAAGLVTAILAGLRIGFFSGAPYQISGPTGAVSAVLIVLHSLWIGGIGWQVCSGLIILALSIFHMGPDISLIPAPVISGFTSGLQ